jgi:outer membrane assembly lipoprotein YfiO
MTHRTRPRERWARCLSWLLAFGLAGCGAAVMPSIHSEGERLTVAHKMYEDGSYGTAADLLKSYIDTNAGSAQVDDAIYLLGNCYLKQREWTLASGEFERLLRDYPESDSAGSASFRLGEALLGQTRPRDFDQEFTIKAIDQWRTYLQGYPGHWLNPEAEKRIAKMRSQLAEKMIDTGTLYLKLRLPTPARAYFAKVVEEYADTTAAPFARIGLAVCDAAEGKKPEAIAQLKEIESEYSGKPPARRALLARQRLEHR